MNAADPPFFVALVPLVAVAFDVYCLFQLRRATDTNYLSKLQWAAVICFFTPFGGISYLMIGSPG